MSREQVRAAVIGAGSWGTTLALLLHRNGHRVALWSFENAVVDEIRAQGRNGTYLPDVQLPPDFEATTELDRALEGAELVVSVSPSQHVRAVMEGAGPLLEDGVTLVSASKGIEIASLRTMDQVLAEVLPASAMERFSVISGPSFALEVAREQPTAVVVASASRETRLWVQRLFSSRTFRVYTNPDVMGVELGGALKNVIALAAGVAAGLGAGHNTLAALITRGLAEIRRLGVAMGAEATTFSGLAGMGDLVLTCTGELSRNRTVGYRLGRGESLDDILGEMTAVAEGVRTAPAVHALAKRHGVEMPIATQVCEILEGRKEPAAAVQELMTRDPKPEDWS